MFEKQTLEMRSRKALTRYGYFERKAQAVRCGVDADGMKLFCLIGAAQRNSTVPLFTFWCPPFGIFDRCSAASFRVASLPCIAKTA
jgi:hypothetical protein